MSRRARKHRLDDFRVAGAPAQVAGQGLPNLISGRPRRALEQDMGREQHAGRTNPALGRAALDECPLQSRQLSAVSHTFARDPVAALNLTDGHETAINDLSVYHYRARSALSFPAPLFRPGRAEILTQNVQKSA